MFFKKIYKWLLLLILLTNLTCSILIIWKYKIIILKWKRNERITLFFNSRMLKIVQIYNWFYEGNVDQKKIGCKAMYTLFFNLRFYLFVLLNVCILKWETLCYNIY